MATLHDGGPPRKKVITYGKTARRRLPDYDGFNTMEHKSATQQSATKLTTDAPVSIAPRPVATSNSDGPPGKAKTPIVLTSSTSRPSKPPTSREDAPASLHTKSTPPKESKMKQVLSPQLPSFPAQRGVPKDVFDFSSGDEGIPKTPHRITSTVKARPKSIAKSKLTLAKRGLQPPSLASTNVFEVPDIEKVPNRTRIVPKLGSSTNQKIKPDVLSSTSEAASAKSSSTMNIYDMDLTEEVASSGNLSQKHITQTTSTSIGRVKDSNQQHASTIEGRKVKRLKVSPEHEQSVHPKSSKLRSPVSKSPLVRPRQAVSSLKTRPINQAGLKPIKTLPLQRPEVPRMIEDSMSGSIEQRSVDSVPYDAGDGADLMDVDVVSPKKSVASNKSTMRKKMVESGEANSTGLTGTNWDILSGRLNERVADSTSKDKLQRTLIQDEQGLSSFRAVQNQKPQRKRLIDSLVRQADPIEPSDNDSSDEEVDSPSLLDHDMDSSSSQSLVPEAAENPVIASDSQSSQLSQTIGPKFTYGRQRSMLAEQDIMKELAMELPTTESGPSLQMKKNRRGSIPNLQPLPRFYEEDEDIGNSQLKTVHELKRAGADSRFLNEVQDLIDGLGHPEKTSPSVRRSGLVDIARKLSEKQFMDQFRAHSMELKLFVHLGQEKDIISGFLMVSLLLLLGSPMPHVMAHLRRQGITRLIIRLLGQVPSIAAICKDRQSNMSRSAQLLVIERHNDLLKLPIWEELQPHSLSPRTSALKWLQSTIKNMRADGNSGDLFSKELTMTLFHILELAREEESWDLPNSGQAIDFYLTLFTLERHSLSARTLRDEEIWIRDFLPILADTLEIACSRPLVSATAVVHDLILKLSVQVTKDNSSASDVLARPSLLARLGGNIITKYQEISRFLMEEELDKILNHLVMLLAAMVNFAESANVRNVVQGLRDGADDPVDGLIQIFVEKRDHTSQADTMIAAVKNVPFGWLSALLGYFCLHPELAARVRVKQPSRTLRPLVSSIQEFTTVLKAVEDVSTDEEESVPQARLTESFEALVAMLKPML